MSKRILNDHIEDIVYRYKIDLEPMISIARAYGMTRQSVYYALKRAGVDTSKALAGSMETTCDMCGKEFARTRQKIRDFNHHFCSSACYNAWLDRGRKAGNKYIEYRYGTTIAREIVSRYIELLPGYIVHHEDRDQRNNDLANLKVFASSGDHVRYHRGFRVPIIWEGSSRV